MCEDGLFRWKYLKKRNNLSNICEVLDDTYFARLPSAFIRFMHIRLTALRGWLEESVACSQVSQGCHPEAVVLFSLFVMLGFFFPYRSSREPYFLKDTVLKPA